MVLIIQGSKELVLELLNEGFTVKGIDFSADSCADINDAIASEHDLCHNFILYSNGKVEDIHAVLDMMHAEREQVVVAKANSKEQVEYAKTVFKAVNARLLILFMAERALRDVNFSKLHSGLVLQGCFVAREHLVVGGKDLLVIVVAGNAQTLYNVIRQYFISQIKTEHDLATATVRACIDALEWSV